MASTPNHAAQGALITFAAIRLLGWLFELMFPIASFFLTPLYTILTTTLMTLGAVIQASPDLFGQFGGLYKEAHDRCGFIYQRMKGMPVIGRFYRLHPFVDRGFHEEGNINEATGKPDKDHWWPEKWWLELFLWLIIAFGFFMLATL